ncbi:hypothetical protein D3C80_2239840 [compost metagenome]
MAVLVAKLHGDLAKAGECLRVFAAQGVGDGKTVDENTLATLGIVDQAMQELQPRL